MESTQTTPRTFTREEREENRRAWVAALRSGEFKQGRDGLHRITDDTYCCLGVACELFNRRYPGTLVIYADCSWTFYDGSVGRLPSVVRNALGLHGFLGEMGVGRRRLSQLNDSGTTFAEIADIIESRPEGLFID